MMQICPEKLSDRYRVVDANNIGFEELYALYRSNKSYFDHFSLPPSRERLVRDMTMLPDGCSKEQKHFLAFFDGDRLTAIMDLISGYPDEQTCYIGLFMVAAELHGRGIGTEIITGLCDALGKTGCKALRLAYGKDYPAAGGFWTKNAFVPIKEVVLEEYGEVIAAQRAIGGAAVEVS